MAQNSNVEKLLPLTPLWFQILLALVDKSSHGYAIIKAMEERTGSSITTATAPVYLALRRLRDLGFIADAGTDGSRKLHRITPFGRRVVRAEAARIVGTMGTLLDLDLVDKKQLAQLMRTRS